MFNHHFPHFHLSTLHLIKRFTSQVVDTPGFGDSNGNDNQYIEEMMNVLDNKLGYANTILLVLEGSVPRFSNSLYAMLRQMTSIFGETWWDFMMIGVRYCCIFLEVNLNCSLL